MSIPNTLIESQVDWMTSTLLHRHVTDDSHAESALAIASKLLNEQETRGNDMRPFRLSTFEGLSCGQVAVGQSQSGFLFRLSGSAARDHWIELYPFVTNISRFDVCATIRLDGPWRDLSYIHLQEARDYQREHSPRLRVTRIDGGRHGNSLLIGSRASDAFGRIYDKGAESGSQAYQDCWRYEVEFKRSLARHVADDLATDQKDVDRAAAIALEWFRRRNCSPVRYIMVESGNPAPAQRSDDDRRLTWFALQVAPSLARLASRGRLENALAALRVPRAALAHAEASPVETVNSHYGGAPCLFTH